MSETAKAAERREREGWHARYAPPHLSGIDIGWQSDPLNATFRRWDIIYGDGDATLMDGVPYDSFHTVYASHVLEHLSDPVTAIRNWYRIARPGWHVVIVVPHRDLYERQATLPSRWNAEHKSLWLPDLGELPDTRGLKETILIAMPGADIILLRTLDDGYVAPGPDLHAIGEYSIEAIIRKRG